LICIWSIRTNSALDQPSTGVPKRPLKPGRVELVSPFVQLQTGEDVPLFLTDQPTSRTDHVHPRIPRSGSRTHRTTRRVALGFQGGQPHLHPDRETAAPAVHRDRESVTRTRRWD